MRYYCARAGVLVSIAFAAVGCTHQQLRWNTVRQSRTLTDIYEQQVLNNLAMFVYDPNSLPFFSFPNAGASNVTDEGQLSSMLTWTQGIGGLQEGTLGLNGSRTMEESWTLTPLVDPIKLQLMRCAYQQVVENCGRGMMSVHCPNCEKMRKAYLGEDDKPQSSIQVAPPPAPARAADGGEVIPAPDRSAPTAAEMAASEGPGQSQSDPAFPGAVNTDCLQPVCWIGHGCKKCMPKHCKCLKAGHYCGVYVWVLPGGQDELTKLTLNILNYAYNDPMPPATKQVTWYIDAHGNAANQDNASVVVAATLPLRGGVTPEGVQVQNEAPRINGARAPLPQTWSGQIFNGVEGTPVRPQPSWIPNAGYLQFQQNLRSLAPSTR